MATPTAPAPLPPIPSAPVTSIPEAIARMQAIEAAMPPTDGLACFNRMYRIVTATIQGQVSGTFFADPAFMEQLDVAFANLYFGAIEGVRGQPPTCCRAWNVLFSQRSATDIAPLQFALAGINAHINRDLSIAVVSTCRALGTDPEAGPHEADFNKVNQILDHLDQQIRESFETGLILELDRKAAGLENIVGNFGLSAARQGAWTNALAMWHLKGIPFVYNRYLDGVDRFAAFAGRSLLLPLL